MEMIVPLLLAGGRGTRLWPLSRKSQSKQVLKFFNHLTMLQSTYSNLQSIRSFETPIIICNQELRFKIAEQIKQINEKAIILVEEQPHNTAAAMAAGTIYASKIISDPLILVMPCDHYISDPEKYANMVNSAIPCAKMGKLVTFGILPKYAKTDYGYIKKGKKPKDCDGYQVEEFIEKPSLEIATEFLKAGDYYWNSGIFLYQASTLVQELKKYVPDILSHAEKSVSMSHSNRDFIFLDDEVMRDCPSISIDVALFEKTEQAVMLDFTCEWQDIGDWETLYRMGEKDKHGNVVNGNVVIFDTDDCYLYSSKPLLVASGLENCLVVATNDAILVSRLDKKQDLKKIVEHLINLGHQEATD